jgi:hypothetical protein
VSEGAAWPDGSEEELRRLLELLPGELRRRVETHPELPALVEVVMDLGRPPLARFPSGDFLLSHHPISFDDLQHATSQVPSQSSALNWLLVQSQSAPLRVSVLAYNNTVCYAFR